MTARRFAIIGNQASALIHFRGPLISAIVERGHTVFALAPDWDETSLPGLAALGAEAVPISLSRVGLNPLRDMADIVRLFRTLAQLDIDTVLGFTIKPVIYGILAARLAGIPNRHALIAGLGYAFGENAQIGLRNRIVYLSARILYTLALSQTRKVFMQNPDDMADFIGMGIVDPEKVVLVNGTGIDLDRWLSLPPVTGPITFILIARLLAEKGILDYIEAARIVKSKAPRTRFILLGALDFHPDAIAREEVEAWVAEGLVEWPGHVSVPPWMAEASVFVLPSYYREGIPRSTQEALASARPVITTDAPGCRETVVEGVNGFLVPPHDPHALAVAMNRFIEEPGLVVSMGADSRAIAEQRFDVHAINRTIIAAIGL